MLVVAAYSAVNLNTKGGTPASQSGGAGEATYACKKLQMAQVSEIILLAGQKTVVSQG